VLGGEGRLGFLQGGSEATPLPSTPMLFLEISQKGAISGGAHSLRPQKQGAGGRGRGRTFSTVTGIPPFLVPATWNGIVPATFRA